MTIVLEIVGGCGGLETDHQLGNGKCHKLTSLRDRIEALGGKFRLESMPDGGLLLVAELNFAEMEPASG